MLRTLTCEVQLQIADETALRITSAHDAALSAHSPAPRGIQAFADWSLASAAIYERRGPGARKHRPPRAVTMPLSGGPEVLGFLMLIIDDSKCGAAAAT